MDLRKQAELHTETVAEEIATIPHTHTHTRIHQRITNQPKKACSEYSHLYDVMSIMTNLFAF